MFVGLKLIERTIDCRGFVARVFEFNHGQRQTVYKHDNIRNSLVVAFTDGKLTHCQEVVVLQRIEIHQLHAISGNRTVRPAVFHFHAIPQPLVKLPVPGNQCRTVQPGDLSERFVQPISRNRRVQSCDRVS